MILLALVYAAFLEAAPASAGETAPPPGPPPAAANPAPPAGAARAVAPQPTAVRLFAAVEEAWSVSDADRLASLVDTTSVRIALKPDAPPTTAITRAAAAFLFRDPMRLVGTREFRVVRVEISEKGLARAQARWLGDWGGQRGMRRVRVHLTAGAGPSGWLLTEVRTAD
ncbi:MAG TPA: hypothetical protein VID50_06765 [Candidatus Eisenbacteria bacterium]|jgi:hypothetical protein